MSRKKYSTQYSDHDTSVGVCKDGGLRDPPVRIQLPVPHTLAERPLDLVHGALDGAGAAAVGARIEVDGFEQTRVHDRVLLLFLLETVEHHRVAAIDPESATPLPIVGGVAQPPMLASVAAPVRSLWQTGAIGMRCLLDVNWAMRRANAVSYMTGTSW